MNKSLLLPCLLGISAVSLGAFGAHGLENTLISHGTLDVWQTAVQYHFYHTLAIFALILCVPRAKVPLILWTFGILIFSGSLYILAVSGIKWLGAITPIGGLLFIVGWFSLLFVKPRLSEIKKTP